jgi:hypothetical protein
MANQKLRFFKTIVIFQSYDSLILTLQSVCFPVSKDEAYKAGLEKVKEWTAGIRPAVNRTSNPKRTKPLNIEAILELYLQDLHHRRCYSLIVKPKRYLGKEWGSVKDAIKTLGGSWIQTCGEERIA